MNRAAIIAALTIAAIASRADAAQDAVKLDQLAAPDPDANAHADEWALRLKQDPTTAGYVIAFEARTGRPGAASKAAHDAVVYMVTQHGIDLSRLHETAGPRRPTATIEFWMVPEGAAPPKPN